MENFNSLYSYLPPEVVKILKEKDCSDMSELRFCLDKPILINNGNSTQFFTDLSERKLIAGSEMFAFVIHKLTGGSMYSVGNNLADGFVTLKGGHRVGICGTAVVENGEIAHIKNISSMCFRVSRELKGCAFSLADEIEHKHGINTILRDLCRILANGELGGGIRKVGIADERSEIAASGMGKTTFDIGVGSFVCDGYPKSVAMILMLRSMSPDVIATDEIGSKEDFIAVRNAQKCGVSVIATAHAGDLEDLKRRFGSEITIFDKIIFLRARGKVKRIYRRSGHDY